MEILKAILFFCALGTSYSATVIMLEWMLKDSHEDNYPVLIAVILWSVLYYLSL